MATALRLYGVTLHDTHSAAKPMDGVELVSFRDLGAVVGPGEYSSERPTGEAIEEFRRVVDGVFTRTSVLPAPVGTVFRSRETLLRWLELHYVALSDALSFVDDRAAARVHIRRQGGPEDAKESGADIAAVAADVFRSLRRQSVAAVPLTTEHLTGIVLSSSFLVEKELWNDFTGSVDEQRSKYPSLQFEISGPWPPFDFVRMQFGG
jgi:hypothetical protein